MNQMQKVNIGIVGSGGYTCGELLRVLLRHPNAHISFVHSTSSAGELVSKVHADLLGDTQLKFTNILDQNIDVLFLCVGHGDANKFLTANEIKASIKIIDLSQDFRLAGSAAIGDRNFVYGLPELQREAIKSATNIANPGCFALCTQLALLPFSDVITSASVTAITGSSGGGKEPTIKNHHSTRSKDMFSYGINTHRHLAEVFQSYPNLKDSLSFVPTSGPFVRGISLQRI